MTWPLPEVGQEFDMWQDGRCGMCGVECDVLDHDHETGLERGYLCARCNRMEGISDAPQWTLWRNGWNPATITGSAHLYNGWGWRNGVHLATRAFASPDRK